MMMQDRRDVIECRTAQDVRELAKRVESKRRQNLLARSPPKPKTTASLTSPTISSDHGSNGEPGQIGLKIPKPLLATAIFHLVVREAAEANSLAPGWLLMRSRMRRVVRARHEAIFIMRKVTGLPVTRLGRIFGGFDHTTIIYAINKGEQRISHDLALVARIGELRAIAAQMKVEDVPSGEVHEQGKDDVRAA